MFVETLANALQQQAHRLAGNRRETLDAQNAMFADCLLQRLQQTHFLSFRQFHVERGEFVVIVVFMAFQVMVGLAALDMQLGLAVQTQQYVERQFAAMGFDDFHRRRQLFRHLRTYRSQGGGVEQVGLVENDQVGAGQLVGEQLVQWRFVVQIGVELALCIDLIREGGEGAGGHGRAVDHSDHGIHRAGIADFRPVEGLYQRLGQGQAGGFNEDMVQLAATRHQLAHHREELFLHGAAQATVGQFKDATVGFFFAATNGALLEDFAVDAQLAEFVDDHRNAPPVGVAEHVPQQGGFAGAEKAGNDGDGKFGEGLHGESCVTSKERRAGGGTDMTATGRQPTPPDHPARLSKT